MKKILFAFAVFGLTTQAQAQRFFYEGDGCLYMYSEKTKKNFPRACYRKADGTYDEAVLKKIDTFLQVPADLEEHFSLRTIAFLDYLQDKYVPNPKTPIRIISGYRSPAYNEGLRQKGKLAGKTSYHLEAMAVDVIFPGVKSEDVWEYAKSLNYGGMGYYRSKALHVDSGKPRFWVPETAIDPDSKPPLNKSMYISVDKDIYHPGETIQMFLSGISDYPYGLKPVMELYSGETSVQTVTPTYVLSTESGCMEMKERHQSRNISWVIPKDFKHKNMKLKFHVYFCEPTYANQPLEIDSRAFEVR